MNKKRIPLNHAQESTTDLTESGITEKVRKIMKEQIEKLSINNSGFVNFRNRKWTFRGDKNTWVRIDEKEVVVKKGKGTISSEYFTEVEEMLKPLGIDFDALSYGVVVRFEIK